MAFECTLQVCPGGSLGNQYPGATFQLCLCTLACDVLSEFQNWAVMIVVGQYGIILEDTIILTGSASCYRYAMHL